MIMNKKLFILPFAALITLLITSCGSTNEPTKYPENLIGFWASTTNAEQQWKGLDVLDANHANLITYEESENIQTEAFELTYDSSNGKGTLIGDGKSLKINARTDSTLIIEMVDGDIIFTKSTKPEKIASMGGYWKSNVIYNEHYEEYTNCDLLVFPKDKNGIVHITYIQTIMWLDTKEQEVVMGTLDNFDPTTGQGEIVIMGSTMGFHVNIAQEPLTFNFENDTTFTYTKQPRANNMPKSLRGIWKSPSALAYSITITVTEDNIVTIDYTVIDTTGNTKSGTVLGDLYYCPSAGMGTLVPQNLEEHPELATYIGVDACGVFELSSATEVNVTFMGIPFTFIKE